MGKGKKKGYSNPWHTKNEKAIAKKIGAKRHHPGYDGVLNGRPYEVREAKRSDVYRIQKNVHNTLCKRNGFYIFKKGPKVKRVNAKQTTKMMKSGRWNIDRKYPYKYVKVSSVF